MFDSAKQSLRRGPLDWVVAIVLSWAIPLRLVTTREVTYFTSLTLWIVPILLLLRRFFVETDRGGRRRRAFAWTVVYITVGGAVLDLVFGAVILDFPGKYVLRVWAVGGTIPIEELIFYLTGGIAIVLVYAWADEHWMHAYNVRGRGEGATLTLGRLIDVSPQTIAVSVGLLLLGIALKRVFSPSGWVPLYYTFLICVAFIPAILMWRAVNRFVNWRAFSFAALYVLLTACIWEITLGLPKGWWGYQDGAMIGRFIDDWKSRYSQYPIEALLVWFVVTFTCVLMYEAVKAYHYAPRQGIRQKLFDSGSDGGLSPQGGPI
jgi:hypothetical protein